MSYNLDATQLAAALVASTTDWSVVTTTLVTLTAASFYLASIILSGNPALSLRGNADAAASPKGSTQDRFLGFKSRLAKYFDPVAILFVSNKKTLQIFPRGVALTLVRLVFEGRTESDRPKLYNDRLLAAKLSMCPEIRKEVVKYLCACASSLDNVSEVIYNDIILAYQPDAEYGVEDDSYADRAVYNLVFTCTFLASVLQQVSTEKLPGAISASHEARHQADSFRQLFRTSFIFHHHIFSLKTHDDLLASRVAVSQSNNEGVSVAEVPTGVAAYSRFLHWADVFSQLKFGRTKDSDSLLDSTPQKYVQEASGSVLATFRARTDLSDDEENEVMMKTPANPANAKKKQNANTSNNNNNNNAAETGKNNKKKGDKDGQQENFFPTAKVKVDFNTLLSTLNIPPAVRNRFFHHLKEQKLLPGYQDGQLKEDLIKHAWENFKTIPAATSG